ncbi:MAG: DUF4242 domain-containing protein [Longimicrobiales bacterium]
MPKFVIERDLADANTPSVTELRDASRRSMSALKELGPGIQWIQTYVTAGKLYCIYIAPSIEALREHARRAGLPANRISPIAATIDPTLAETAGTETVGAQTVPAE